MKLIVINPETRLPELTGEALTIPEFNTIWTRVNRIDGDRDGSKKARNLQEIGFIYFNCVYDTRFKNYEATEKDLKIKVLLKLPSEWIPDEVVKDAMVIYSDLQVTGTLELVDALEGTNADLALWVKAKRIQLKAGQLSAKDTGELLDIIDRLPKTVQNVKAAKETLIREQDALATGRKSRRLGKFEIPAKAV